MTRSGMTGFARLSGSADWGQWTWEVRSVNGRGLDLRLNLPTGFESLESHIRETATRYFTRGNMQISLRISRTDSAQTVDVNSAVLAKLVAAHEAQLGAPITAEALASLMGIKGVVTQEAATTEALQPDSAALGACKLAVEDLFTTLRAARQTEGQKLQTLMLGHLAEIRRLQLEAQSYASAQTQAIRQRFQERLQELQLDAALDDDRFAAEVAVLAAKADVTEELDRLDAHIDRGHQLFEQTDAIGRDLGFLAQELNREANTLCAKSAHLELTNTGLALKSIIDQLKEQAANVE